MKKLTEAPISREKFIVISVAGGFATFALLIAVIFATGSSFGQRCAYAFPGDFRSQKQCISDLSAGRQALEAQEGLE